MQPVNKPGSRKILSAGAVRVSRDRIPAAIDNCGDASRIETRQLNGVVSEIVVTCGCGRKTVIECDYNEVAAARPPKV